MNKGHIKKYINSHINSPVKKAIQTAKKDKRLLDLQKNSEFSVCKQYNRWIDTQRTAFTLEYLKNVNKFNVQTVDKYFITKDHPGGHDPRGTYHKSKLNCTQYKPPSISHPKGPAQKAPTSSLRPPTTANVKQGLEEKNGRSVPDLDSGSAKTEHDENIPPKSKSHTSDSHIPSQSKTLRDGTSTVQDTPVKTEARGSSVNRDDEKKESILVQGQPPINSPPSAQAETPPQTKSPPLPPEVTSPTTAIQGVSEATPTTVKNTTSSQTPVTSSSLTITSDSSLNSGSPLPSNLLPPTDDTKGQSRAPQSSITSGTLESTHPNQSILSTEPKYSSLPQPQDPVLTVSPAVTTANEPGTPASSSASTFTTPVTTTTTSPATDTRPTMSKAQAPILSTQQGPSASNSQEPPHPSASEPRATVPITVTQAPTSVSRSDTGGISVPAPVTEDGSKQTSLSGDTTSKPKDIKQDPGSQLSSIITQPSRKKPDKVIDAADAKLRRSVDQTDQMRNKSPDQIVISKDPDQLNLQVDTNQGKILNVKPGKDLVNNPVAPKEKNDNPNIIPDEIPSLTHIIPTLLYTPFGFLLGRRRKRKKRDLRSTFVIPEESTYESPNITVHEWEDPNLVGQTVENDVYTKLLKINRYKQEMQNRKKKNKKTLIEVHMEVLEEHKNDEWELHKGDFLEICLREFINKENETYQKFPNSKLTINNIKNEKTIEDIQKHEILWNNWIEDHRHILEQWKKEEWFHILKNKWRNEEKKYKEKNDKLQENISNEQEKYSIVSQKDIWKQWISKQATLIDLFNKEDWFKSMVYAQNKEKDNYHINEYNNISLTNKTELKNEKTNHEEDRSKNIIQKLMVQIHMMVLEECIKEEMIKQKELCIDNFIEDIHNENNYDEKKNMPQCHTDNFNNTKPDFPCTHARKCAKIYDENIVNCSIFEDEFCKKLKAFRGILINHLVSLRICKNAQDIILSVDNKTAESTSKNQREESAQATTISVSSFGTIMKVSVLSLFLYKVTPLCSWLSPRIENLGKTLNVVDNDKNESLFNYTEPTEYNYTCENYNIAYHFVGNS
ncbi:STP1 protein [Plasmodium ovale wallikeri]|uniref:STP1 protein n=1 Tax=Plasmodium ovale wallikeri TaxID=864142 RepID=A0A1A9ALP6_PLAOA|nr:STP1 protein [Plasmodium ovale wallikeri]